MTNKILSLSHKTLIINRKEYLKIGGTSDTNLYYIESGSVRIFVLNEAGEQNIRLGYKGNFVVALDSFLLGKPSDLYIQTIKKSVVKVIAKSQIDQFLQDENHRILWGNFLTNLTLEQMEREMDLLTHSPKERYKRVLKRSPQLFQEIPNRHIANYLRMNPETLSRLKKS